ncbi:ATP-binding protein [Cedecea lapagei]|uniref:ATP-binding protein n=1 Tax=Cedecea lapagei TaxID=158823 RepID=UPI001BCD0DA8
MTRKFVPLFRYTMLWLCAALWLHAGLTRAAELDEDLARFSAALSRSTPAAQVSLQTLQQLDAKLLKPEFMYPQFQAWSLPDLTAFYQLDKRCASGDELSPSVKSFLAALCQPNIPPAPWFAANPLYPLGGSSAWQYILRHPGAAAVLRNSLHVRERPDDLAGIGRLSDDNLDALLGGQRWLLQNGQLWRFSQQQWQRYEAKVWQPLAQQSDIELVNTGGRCDMRAGALCVNVREGYRDVWRWLFGLLALFTASGLIWMAWQRRQLRERQRFITQMLTHELRTPIAQLSNVVEHFRRDFDQLPEGAQLNFMALADTLQRMRQMADTSKHYLIAEHQREALETPTQVRLSDWLDHLCADRDGLTYCLKENMIVGVSLYWSSLCLTNLLDNASRHGKPPVHLTVHKSKTHLIFQVSDSGNITQNPLLNSRRLRWSSSSLGLGLTIVQRVARRLNGKLTFSPAPTTFTLELPYDPD